MLMMLWLSIDAIKYTHVHIIQLYFCNVADKIGRYWLVECTVQCTLYMQKYARNVLCSWWTFDKVWKHSFNIYYNYINGGKKWNGNFKREERKKTVKVIWVYKQFIVKCTEKKNTMTLAHLPKREKREKKINNNIS